MKSRIVNFGVSVWGMGALALILSGCSSGTNSPTVPVQVNPTEPKLQAPEQEKLAELKWDAQLEAKLTLEREKGVEAIANMEKEYLQNLVKFAAPPSEKNGALGFSLSANRAFSHDGKLLAITTFNGIFIWDLANGKQSQFGTSMQPIDVAFSPDSKWIAVLNNLPLSKDWDRLLKDPYNHLSIWDLQNRKKTAEIEHGYKIFAFRFLPDSERLLTAGVFYEFHPDGLPKAAIFTIKWWDCGTGQKIKELQIQGVDKSDNEEVRAAAFSPDGEKLAIAISDRDFPRTRGAVRILRVKDGALLRKLSIPDIYHANLVFSPDGWRLAINHTTGPISAMKYHFKEWDLAIDKAHSLRGSEKGPWPVIVYSPDGKFITFDGFPFKEPFSIWSVHEKKIVFSTEKMDPPEAISPGGTFLLTRDGHIWNFKKLISEKK